MSFASLRSLFLLFLLVLATPLAGCGTLPSIEGPEPAFRTDNDVQQLRAQLDGSVSIAAYYAPGADQRAIRDKLVTIRLAVYDLEFARWASNFTLSQATTDTILDTAKLSLDAAIGLTGGPDAKSALAAVSGVLTGSRLSFEKNFFDQKTSEALIAQMIAQRKSVLVGIETGLDQGVDQYPLSRALADLQDYYMAGTLTGALMGIQEQAQAKAASADHELKRLRASTFVSDDATHALLNWLYPGYVKTVNGQRLDQNGQSIAVNQANLDALRQWKDGDPTAQNIGMGDLLNGDKFAPLRAQALHELKIGQ